MQTDLTEPCAQTGVSGTILSARDSWLVWLLAASLIGAILQITLGGVVRVTESGDGCPDWPLCYGRLAPPIEKHALIEWSHRTAGALVGLALLAATVRAWTKTGSDKRATWLHDCVACAYCGCRRDRRRGGAERSAPVASHASSHNGRIDDPAPRIRSGRGCPAGGSTRWPRDARG